MGILLNKTLINGLGPMFFHNTAFFTGFRAGHAIRISMREPPMRYQDWGKRSRTHPLAWGRIKRQISDAQRRNQGRPHKHMVLKLRQLQRDREEECRRRR